MTFANANAFLLLLLLVPLAVLKIIGDGVARRRLHRIAGPRLLPQLRRGGWRGRGLLIFLFEALALTLLVATLARPQWGFTQREIHGQGRSIIIAIDTSRSMLATDLTPDRLTRAKLAAQDLINSLPGDKIGLIAFAGRAFLQAPLTTDHEALLESLSQFDTELIPRGGTNLAEPIELAAEVFDKAGTASHALIMFSDGDELEGQGLAAARKARENNIMVIAVGVGTREGALLPDESPRRRGGYQRDVTGRPVRSQLDDAVLENIARETGGLYLNLSGTSVLKERIEVILNKLDRSKTAALKDQRQAIDRYHWTLLPALACLVIAWLLRLGRRLRPSPMPAWSPTSAALPAVTAALIVTAMAQTASGGVLVPTNEDRGPSPWQAFQQAEAVTNVPGELTDEQKALKKQVYDVVTERFDRVLAEDPKPARAAEVEFGRGASLFRAGDHDAAIDAFGKALTSPDRTLQAEAAYNLGNALADKAKNFPKQKNRLKSMIALVEEAIRHYDEALSLEPNHENARINRDLLKDYLPKLQEERQRRIEEGKKRRQNQQGQQQGQQQGEQQGQQQQGQQGQDGQQGQQGQQGQPGAGDDSEEETDDEGEGEEPGDQGGGEQEGEGRQGEQPGEQPGQAPGDQDGDGEGGKNPSDREQAGPEGNDKERRGEQEGEGPLGAKGGGQGGDGDQSSQSPKNSARDAADAKRNPKTGFSRSEARALLRALADEDYVRPLTDEAVPEGTYKNW
jgi:Ca-activated chloride channel family protein